jgi:DNA-directed RNA polymerase omega subunit
MKEEKTFSNKLNPFENNSLPKTKKESIFQLIIVACQRHKQLNNGAHPRIELPSLKTKKTKIAIEEVNQGLIMFTTVT